MKIGQLIKELRLQRGYSQLYLSNKTGLSERTIQRLENNHVNPSSNTLRLLGNVFDEDFLKFKNQEIIINKYKKINIMYVYWNLTIKFIIKILNLLLTLGLLESTSAMDTFLAKKMDLVDTDYLHFSLETDFNLGYQFLHEGKPSDYNELADEYRFSVNWKHWFKVNIGIADTAVNSWVFEFTVFEF